VSSGLNNDGGVIWRGIWPCGNALGGQTAAIFNSMTSTCRPQGIDPQHYLTQLLANLPAMPISQIDQWLPDRWLRLNPSL